METVHFEVAPPVDEAGRMGNWNTEWWGTSRLAAPEVIAQRAEEEPQRSIVQQP